MPQIVKETKNSLGLKFEDIDEVNDFINFIRHTRILDGRVTVKSIGNYFGWITDPEWSGEYGSDIYGDLIDPTVRKCKDGTYLVLLWGLKDLSKEKKTAPTRDVFYHLASDIRYTLLINRIEKFAERNKKKGKYRLRSPELSKCQLDSIMSLCQDAMDAISDQCEMFAYDPRFIESLKKSYACFKEEKDMCQKELDDRQAAYERAEEMAKKWKYPSETEATD